MIPVLCSRALWEAAGDGLMNWVPPSHVEDLGSIPGPRLQPGPVPSVLDSQRVNQQKGALLCLCGENKILTIKKVEFNINHRRMLYT